MAADPTNAPPPPQPSAGAAAGPSVIAEPAVVAPTIAEVSAERLSNAAENVTATPWRPWHSISLFITIGLIVLLGSRAIEVPAFNRWLAIMVLMTAFIAIAGNGIGGRWSATLIDERNMISLSRMQLLVWTIVVLGAFLTAGLSNIRLGADDPLVIRMPQQLWVLMGISTTTLAATPLLQGQKKAQDLSDLDEKVAPLTVATLEAQKGAKTTKCNVVVEGRLVAHTSPSCASWGDMFRGDEISNGAHLDLSKVQLFFFTIILVIAYAAALSALFTAEAGIITAFPALDSSVVALLGISHAGYLTSQVTQSGAQ